MSRKRGWKTGDKLVCISYMFSDLTYGKIYTYLSQHYERKTRWVEVDCSDCRGTLRKNGHKYYERSRFITLGEYRKIKLQKIECTKM
jgi:predicted transcriptional regulator with HTH domain